MKFAFYISKTTINDAHLTFLKFSRYRIAKFFWRSEYIMCYVIYAVSRDLKQENLMFYVSLSSFHARVRLYTRH